MFGGFVACRLNLPDLAGDIFRGIGRLLGERLDLPRDDRKSSSKIASACGLNRGVQGQKISLPGDFLDEADNVSDLGC